MELSWHAIALPERLDIAGLATFHKELGIALASAAPVIVLTGASPSAFCLGLALHDDTLGGQASEDFAALIAALFACPKPLLAVVDGAAIGGGLGIACLCDWVIATSRASFALPELLWGLVPAIIFPALEQRMTQQEIRRWCVTAHSRTAEEVAGSNLIDRLVDVVKLEQATLAAVSKLARLEPSALMILRQWGHGHTPAELRARLDTGAALTGSRMQRRELRARWNAFERGDAPWSA